MRVPSGRTASTTALSGRLVAALLAFALVLTGLTLLGGASAAAEAGPSITSDQADYPPGARVTLTGAGWQVGEPVHVTVNDDQGRTWQRDVDLTADDAGTVTDSFNLPDWFVATYAVVATGTASGTVRTSFTDGNVKVSTLAGNGSQQVSVQVSYSVTANVSSCPSAYPTSSFTATATEQNLTGGAGDNDRVKIVAPATVTDGNGVHTFLGWLVGSSTVTDPTLCTSGSSTGSKSLVLKYSLGTPTDATTTTTVSTSASPSTYGDQVTFTATVDPSPSGAGTVTFTDGANTLCSAVPVSSGTATCDKVSSLDAGSHMVTASYSGATGFKASSGQVVQSVAKKQVTGGFTAGDKVYDGTKTAAISGRSLTAGVLAADAGSVTMTGGTATFDTPAAGVGKTVTGTGFSLEGSAAGNYVLASTTLTTTAKIGQQGVTIAFTAGDKEYDGTTGATIKSSSITSGRVAGDDLTVSGGTAAFATKDAGSTKTVTASGFTLGGTAKDNYVVSSVTPTTASITAKPVTGSFTAASKTYDRGTDATVTSRSLVGALGKDAVSLTGGTAAFIDRNAGTGKTVTLTGASLTGTDAKNYDLRSVSDATADITPKSVDGSFTAENKPYDGNASAHIASRSLTGVIDGDTVSLTGGVAAFADKAADTGKTVTGSGFTLGGADAGNYRLSSGTLTAKADITQRQVTGSFAAADKVYDGRTDATVESSSVSGAISGDDVSLQVSGAAFGTKNVGDAKTVTGTLSLAGEDAGSYVLAATDASTRAAITARHVTGGFTAKDKVYDATRAAEVAATSLDNAVPGDDVTLNGGRATFADAAVGSDKAVTLTGAALSGDDAGNYVLDSVGTAMATIGRVALEVTADPATKVYGAGDPTLTYRVTRGALQGDDTLRGELTRAPGKDVGSYPIEQGSLDAGSNYALTFVPSSLSITPKALTVTADDTHRTYGTGNPDFTVSYDGFVPGDDATDLGGTLGFSTEADKASPVGDYRVTPSGLSSHNYDLTFEAGTLTVDRRDLTITAPDARKTYGDQLALDGTEFAADGLVNGDTVTSVTLSSAGAAATAAVSDYRIVASKADGLGLGNYKVSYRDGTLAVTKRPLTITADNRGKTYGERLVLGTTGFDARGLANDDWVAAVELRSDGVDPGAPADRYAVTAGDAVAGGHTSLGNYEVTYRAGTLTVHKAPLTVTVQPATKVYGDPNPTFGVSFAGLVNGETEDVLDGTVSYGTSATATSGVGSYDVVPSGLTADNYEIAFEKGALSVTPASLTITPDHRSKTYGDELSLGTDRFDVRGLVNGDSVSAVRLGSDGADAGAAAGTYPITASEAVAGDHTDLGNYTIGYEDGQLTVDRAPLSIRAADASRVYGDANPELHGSVIGIRNGDPVVASYSTSADRVSGVGRYAIVPNAAGRDGVLANYDVTLTPGTLTVTPRPLTITARDQDKTYGSTTDLGTTGFDVTGLANGDAVAGVELGSTGAAATAPVGRYELSAAHAVGAVGTSLGNYDVRYRSGTLTVEKAPLVVTATDRSKTYGDALSLGTRGFTTSGLVNDDTVTSVTLSSDGASAGAGAGSYPLLAAAAVAGGSTDLGNYAVSYRNGTLTVARAPLTVAADSKTRLLGAQNPALTGTVTGVRNSDPVLASYGTTADAGSPVGTYPIVPNLSGTAPSVLANYDVQQVNGTLTVMYRWDGFLQPINDTAHQTGLQTSQFRLGQTVPVKFVLKTAAGTTVTQSTSPSFRATTIGTCGTSTTPESGTTDTADSGSAFKWDGTQYQYNWSTKGLSQGLYRVRAVLNDGNPGAYVDVCLTK